jgi:hypothetical protein
MFASYGWLLLAEEGVEDRVAPGAGSVEDRSEDAFALEADLCQGSLLGDVVDLGIRLEAVCWGGVEQVGDEEALGGRAYAVAPVFGEEGDADLVGGAFGALRVWSL